MSTLDTEKKIQHLYRVVEDLHRKSLKETTINNITVKSDELVQQSVESNIEPLEQAIKAFNLGPGTGEVGLATSPSTRSDLTNSFPPITENNNFDAIKTDFVVAIENLKNSFPNLKELNCVISWFFDTTELGQCKVFPIADKADKVVFPYDWKVSGVYRAIANYSPINPDNGRQEFGGTPADWVVIEGILHIVKQEINFNFYPFLMHNDSAKLWRGFIISSNNGTPQALTDTENFFGNATDADFTISNGEVIYSGTEESYNRFILHNAYMLVLAASYMTQEEKSRLGKFYIGSEMERLTLTHSTDPGSVSSLSEMRFPVIEKFIDLAIMVRRVFDTAGLQHVKLSYASNYTEYKGKWFGNNYFDPLDSLWGHPVIDFVAIDYYPSVTDWRPGNTHKDFGNGYDVDGNLLSTTYYSHEYIKSRIESGAEYDWFYNSQSDRDNQIRTPIDDFAGEDWRFGFKDLRGWWENEHVSRINGIKEDAVKIPMNLEYRWIAKSKPIVLSEVGVSAMQFGANQSALFADSAAPDAAPYYSDGSVDELSQRLFLESLINYYSEEDSNFINSDEFAVWVADARGYYNQRPDLWADANLGLKSHVINLLGRSGPTWESWKSTIPGVYLIDGVPKKYYKGVWTDL